jgi:hypothetical protein
MKTYNREKNHEYYVKENRREYFKKRRDALNAKKGKVPREYRTDRSTYEQRHITGGNGELKALEILKGSTLDRKHGSCDVRWEGKKVEVKTSIKRHPIILSRKTREFVECPTFGWRFDVKRQRGRADLFLLILNDLEGRVEYVLLIPDAELTVSQLNIAERHLGNFDKYRLTL